MKLTFSYREVLFSEGRWIYQYVRPVSENYETLHVLASLNAEGGTHRSVVFFFSER